jgi:hypothetical protein
LNNVADIAAAVSPETVNIGGPNEIKAKSMGSQRKTKTAAKRDWQLSNDPKQDTVGHRV